MKLEPKKEKRETGADKCFENIITVKRLKNETHTGSKYLQKTYLIMDYYSKYTPKNF